MRVLVYCEESQAVTKAFRAKGHEAYSCDILPCSGGHPEWHIKAGESVPSSILHKKWNWDTILAFPPCTYLTVSANRWYNVERYGDAARQRLKDRELAVAFFMEIVNAPCKKIAIENTVCVMSTRYRKPDQIIHPWMFGTPEQKSTCLWLKGLPLLTPTNIVEGRHQKCWRMGPSVDRSKLRSKTDLGIADAMAEQWAN